MAMVDGYKTVYEYAEVEYVVEKSKFIGYIKSVQSESEAEAFIAEIKSKNKTARHNVPVYIIGMKNEIQRYSDDGEPSGTAGVPILEMFKKEELKNIVVVITRYFGGIKLGTGGLVRAYTTTAKMALEASGIVEKTRLVLHRVRIDYSILGKLQNEVSNQGYILKDIIFDEKVDAFIYAKPKDCEKMMVWIQNMSSGKAIVEKLNEAYLIIKDQKILV